MSPKECQIANWSDVGQADGLLGKNLSFLNQRRSDCAEANIQIDQAAYLKGRDQGLKTYCQLGNAAQIGLRGEVYEGVCPPAIDQEFRRRYNIGFDIHRFKDEIARLRYRLGSLEERLRKNQHEFEQRLGSRGKNEDHQRLYHDFQREQDRIREEQSVAAHNLQWNQGQLINAEMVLQNLR
ncbi:DUF2799 domain-containing protein [Propionivibrio dicarboxylicus]|nr:DUF2799 domain-containing protein [Propionivibrio dicarboxylicus]